jgi:hypothetical protein
VKGPRALKHYVAKYRAHLKAVRWDDLAIFRWERCKKWRKQNRKARDGSHGSAASHIEH